MSIAQHNAILWSDIQNTYNKLSAARSHFGLSTNGIGGGQGAAATAATYNGLINQSNDLRTNFNVTRCRSPVPSNVANTLSFYATVSQGGLIQPTIANMANQLNTVATYCYFTCSFNNFDADGSNDFSDMDASSRKLKRNIVKTSINALEELNKINIVNFKYNNNNKQKIGFIAEDTETLFTSESHDKMDMYNCIGITIKAIQELSNKIENIEKEIKHAK